MKSINGDEQVEMDWMFLSGRALEGRHSLPEVPCMDLGALPGVMIIQSCFWFDLF